MNQFANRVPFVAGLILLGAAEGLTGVQSSQPRPVEHPPKPTRTVRPKPETPEDDCARLKYTDEQQAKIDKIHQNTKAALDAVEKDEKLRPEQKSAMLEGYRRIERAEIYDVLTPEQRIEVRKKVRARRASDQGEQKKQYPPKCRGEPGAGACRKYGRKIPGAPERIQPAAPPITFLNAAWKRAISSCVPTVIRVQVGMTGHTLPIITFCCAMASITILAGRFVSTRKQFDSEGI